MSAPLEVPHLSIMTRWTQGCMTGKGPRWLRQRLRLAQRQRVDITFAGHDMSMTADDCVPKCLECLGHGRVSC